MAETNTPAIRAVKTTKTNFIDPPVKLYHSPGKAGGVTSV
jgi:hypothetical protein